MFQGGEIALQAICGEFDSHRVHQHSMKDYAPVCKLEKQTDLDSVVCRFESDRGYAGVMQLVDIRDSKPWFLKVRILPPAPYSICY